MKTIWKLLLRASVVAVTVLLATLPTGSRPADADGPCQVGTPSYNPTLCAQVFGTSTNASCQVGTASYNQALCAQSSSVGNSIACQLGTANPALCPQAGSNPSCSTAPNTLLCFLTSQNGSLYCQLGTPSYNQALCAQSNGQDAASSCQLGALNYNASLCGTGGVTQTGAASSITVSAPPTVLGCGGASRIAANANMPGATLNFTTSLGTISPATAVDQGSGVTAILNVPENQGGIAIVKVTSGTATGSTQVTVNCTAAPAAVAQAPAAVAQAPAPLPIAVPVAASSQLSVISPPNTGDGGLKH